MDPITVLMVADKVLTLLPSVVNDVDGFIALLNGASAAVSSAQASGSGAVDPAAWKTLLDQETSLLSTEDAQAAAAQASLAPST